MPPNDRARLERLCRYVARAPLASDRLEQGPGKLLIYRLRHRWRDGTTHVLFEPVELLERLAALVPPPRFNLVRYHGVLGPAASRRATVVSRAAAPDEETVSLRRLPCCPGTDSSPGQPETKTSMAQPGPDRAVLRRPPTGPPSKNETRLSAAPHDEDRPRRYAWADLMRRVFAVDVLECPRCAGPMRILTAIHPPTATRAILECLDLPSRAPPVAPPPPEAEAFSEDLDVDIDFGA